MRVQTQHSFEQLFTRAQFALDVDELIEIVETHESPSAAEKTAKKFGYAPKEQYSTWALATLKRDYFDLYSSVPEVDRFRSATPQKAPHNDGGKS
jgi:hypothetical protein